MGNGEDRRQWCVSKMSLLVAATIMQILNAHVDTKAAVLILMPSAVSDLTYGPRPCIHGHICRPCMHDVTYLPLLLNHAVQSMSPATISVSICISLQ